MIQVLMALKFLSRGSMKGEKVGMANSLRASMSPGSIFRILMRFFQLIMGIVVIGLYAQDLTRAHNAGVKYDSKWMYATITGTLASFWAIVCMLPLVKAWFLFGIDFIVFILYIAAFGIFGKMYINEDPEGNGGIIRMKHAVWILLVNMLLWFTSFVYGAVVFWKYWKGKRSPTMAV
ncbi:uncharacterized protein N0V89_003452 [Didymosphaeria variabile]|uniref:MARVEL domain-containing protein n=1 Tax=Didymosphaeria variabile TaxID=1932322 RepID=A0A9W9CCQ9_9PLEO|nr:uncharacterized protein N0V89_003452 [Didymosphaeria variabile]KAJ4355436.1 hypothetical protein N0V89_003452 [Didymosphaeria variabile]